MKIEATCLEGVYTVQIEPIYDERGFFARTYDADMFRQVGLSSSVAQTSLSQSHFLGTLRGLHWQAYPGRETKLVRVVKGRIFDVVVDLRPDSRTLGGWMGIELSVADGRALFIPARCAHGFLTLEDDTQVLYQMSEPYRRDLARTLRWDDPDVGIVWPIAPRVLSRQDAECVDRIADLIPARVA